VVATEEEEEVAIGTEACFGCLLFVEIAKKSSQIDNRSSHTRRTALHAFFLE
jgi:hypothetical protein